MNIDGLGEKIVEQLIEEKLIENISDIYQLKFSDLEKLEGFKDKSINNLLDSIEKSKTVALERFIFSLGIRHVGIQTSKVLSKKYKNIKNIYNISKDELLDISDIGPEVSESIYKYFASEKNHIEIEKLLELGVNPIIEQAISGKFTNEVVVVTGTLPSLKRNEAHALIEKNGGEIANSISKKVTLVLAGDDAGSKLEKAQKLGIKIISEEELFERLK